jgi:uncharacterized protein (DUF362 family)/Pyruvate/2-oxoacid:ferredoxin oxidoreductase delta subunit
MKIETVWERTGYRQLCEEEQVPLVNMEKLGSRRIKVGSMVFSVSNVALEADAIISVPKVKTHVWTILTGAVKNMYGLVPGFQKTTLHKEHPRPADFGRLLATLYKHVRPVLSIADGVVGMQGDGPSGGEPAFLGFVAASGDAVALDTVLCEFLGIPVRSVPYFEPLRRLRLGQTHPEQIDVLGEVPSSALRTSFRVPSTIRGRLVPAWLVGLLKPYVWIRPQFTADCISCGRCAKACPASALTIAPSERPVLNIHRCLECCCCHEVCPKNAVVMVQSPLLSLLRRRRRP